jgi:hypothetical protein
MKYEIKGEATIIAQAIPYRPHKHPFSWKGFKEAFFLSCSPLFPWKALRQFNALLQDWALSAASESLPEELPESESATNLTISHFSSTKLSKNSSPTKKIRLGLYHLMRRNHCLSYWSCLSYYWHVLLHLSQSPQVGNCSLAFRRQCPHLPLQLLLLSWVS